MFFPSKYCPYCIYSMKNVKEFGMVSLIQNSALPNSDYELEQVNLIAVHLQIVSKAEGCCTDVVVSGSISMPE